jgi:hypothetical protein
MASNRDIFTLLMVLMQNDKFSLTTISFVWHPCRFNPPTATTRHHTISTNYPTVQRHLPWRHGVITARFALFMFNDWKNCSSSHYDNHIIWQSCSLLSDVLFHDNEHVHLILCSSRKPTASMLMWFRLFYLIKYTGLKYWIIAYHVTGSQYDPKIPYITRIWGR